MSTKESYTPRLLSIAARLKQHSHNSSRRQAAMHDMLMDIVTKKRVDLTEAKKILPLARLRQQVLATPYLSIFTEHINGAQGTAVIAEIKFASPTNPQLGSATEFSKRAITYEQAGADALSFITER